MRTTVLLGLTGLLVIVGCGMYVNGSVGWAQLLWVLASGTAGAGVMAWLDEIERHDSDGGGR